MQYRLYCSRKRLISVEAMCPVDEMHGIALGKGERLAGEPAHSLPQREVSAPDDGWAPFSAAGGVVLGAPPGYKWARRGQKHGSLCNLAALCPRTADTSNSSGRLASTPPLVEFCGTAPHESTPRSSWCPHTTTVHPTPTHRLPERAGVSRATSVEAKNRARHHDLFLSHEIKVGRETPKTRCRPRIEGRSL